MQPEVEWLEPTCLEDALAIRAERPDATPIAGGTFVGILINQGLLFPTALLSLRRVDELHAIDSADDELAKNGAERSRTDGAKGTRSQ